MDSSEKKILDNITKAFIEMSERDKENLVYFSEGMAFKINRDAAKKDAS